MPFAGSQGMVGNAQGRLARLMGEYEEAQRLHREAIELYAASSLPGGLAYSYSCLGFADEWRGDLEAAQRHHREALHHARVSGDAFAIALGLEGVGAAAIVSGDVVRGVTLIHAGLALRDRAGTPLPPGERLETERALATASRAVGADKLDAAAAAGAELSVDEAIALAEEAALC